MSKQILVVEDDVAIMETLGIFLRYEGYEVLKARSVEQALESLGESQPDLVLLDYMLQDDTAEPVVRDIRSRYQDQVVVILLTAADDPTGKGVSLGVDGVVAKPFELDHLLEKIQTALEDTEEVEISTDIGIPLHQLSSAAFVLPPIVE